MDRKDIDKLIARNILLEAALVQSHHTISFMHGCLTEDRYEYAYPKQTTKQLKAISDLVEIPEGCPHSMHRPDCDSCIANAKLAEKMAWANQVMGGRSKFERVSRQISVDKQPNPR
jgi:hypothetical protein